ncbi:unnamed protein product [Discosporangium mesarthrocarpum]
MRLLNLAVVLVFSLGIAAAEHTVLRYTSPKGLLESLGALKSRGGGESKGVLERHLDRIAEDSVEEFKSEIWARDVDVAEEVRSTQHSLYSEKRPGAPAGQPDFIIEGLHLAERRSFFHEARRLVLLAEGVVLLLLAAWQSIRPTGGPAALVFAKRSSPPQAGTALAFGLYQSAMLPSLCVFFGCDRIVLVTVRIMGVNHLLGLLWMLEKLATGADLGLFPFIGVCWLGCITGVSAYFGRNL